MAIALESVSDLEARIGAFDELLATLKGCASRGFFYSIDDIQRALSEVIAGGGGEGCPVMQMFLAIAIQRLVFA